MATRKSTKKKAKKQAKTLKKTSKKKPVAKKSSKKVSKKNTKSRGISTKKTSKNKAKKSTSKNISKKSKSSPKKTSKEVTEKETIKHLLQEIKSLEHNNNNLAEQLDKVQTKQEIISELKSYLSEHKGSSTYPEYNTAQRVIEETNKQLEQERERAKNKDKLISKLKFLVSKKEEDDPDSKKEVKTITREEVPKPMENKSSIEDIRHTFPSSVDANTTVGTNHDIEIEVEESNTYKDDSADGVEEITTNDKPEVTEDTTAEDIIKQKVAEIEERDEKNKELYQTKRKRGVITPEEAEEYSEKLKLMDQEINKVFIGQKDAVKGVLISVLCDAHSLLEGVPGLAKTLLIETLGLVVDGTTFKRIQFLPDLLPSDIIGGQVFNPKTAEYKIYKGPIFANFVLADEINRAPPKTHAAIMEAMQEKKINIENETFILDRPFFVLATQNPLENKGTYELPEAVLDRFMFKVILDYPERKYELDIITENATTKDLKKSVKAVLTKQEILDIQKKVKKVFISDKIREYIMDLVEATRGKNKNIEGMKFVKYGAGVRASIYLCLAAQANAVFEGRNYVLPDDVDAIATSVLRHRVVVNYRGKAHSVTPEKIVEEILAKVKAL